MPRPSGKVALLSCARNVEETASTLLADADALDRALDHRLCVYVFEEGSTDRTREVLRAWARTSPTCNRITHQTLARDALRTERLAACRNRLWQQALRDGAAQVIVVDADYERPLDREGLVRELASCRHTGCFAASRPYLYDQWALRDARYGDTDVFREGLATHLARWPLSVGTTELRPVRSAFNGLGVYDASAVREAIDGGCAYVGRYPDGYPVCEHVPFHLCLAERANATFVVDGGLASPFSGAIHRSLGLHDLLALSGVLLGAVAACVCAARRSARKRRPAVAAEWARLRADDDDGPAGDALDDRAPGEGDRVSA